VRAHRQEWHGDESLLLLPENLLAPGRRPRLWAAGQRPADGIHAGLECGIIGGKYRGLDMVSFGPTIRGLMRRASRCTCSRSSAAGICSRRSWRQLSKQARRDEDQLCAKNQAGQPMGWTRRLRSENQLKFKQLLCFERSAQELDHGLTVSLHGGPLSVYRPRSTSFTLHCGWAAAFAAQMHLGFVGDRMGPTKIVPCPNPPAKQGFFKMDCTTSRR
jgi:hypothetical protein